MVLTIIRRFLVTEDFFEFNLKFLFLVGLWPGENLSARQLKLYKIYEMTLDLFMIIYLTLTGISIFQCTDIILFLSNIDKSLVAYNCFFKTICFLIKREKLKILINDIMRSGDKVTDENRDNMIKIIVMITSLTTILVVIFSMVGFYNNEMSVDAWMPFNPHKNKMNLALSSQIMAVLFAVPFLYRAMGMQGIVCSFLIYMCNQLEELQKRLRNLKYTKDNEKIMREELKTIVKKHIRLMRYSKSMESSLKQYFLVQHFAVTVELCMNAVLVTTITWDRKFVIFEFIVYLGIALINAYVYCYLGNNLMEQSEDIAQAAFDSDWTCFPVDLQKTILLIITVAQRPFKMSAGGITIINMESFGTALYNGYTIFTVLNDMVN